VQELILYTNVHSSVENISSQSDAQTVIKDKQCTEDSQSTFSTSCTIYCTGLPGVTLGYNKMRHSMLMQTSFQ